MNVFKYLIGLFAGAAKDAGHQILSDEIKKANDEISVALAPLLQQIPDENKDQALAMVVAAAKQAAITTAEAYINAHMPLPPITSPSEGAKPAQ